MLHDRAGVSLPEVLVASLLLAAGLMPVGYGVAAAARLSMQAEARWRVALALSSRQDALEQVAASTVPRCATLQEGTGLTDGITESWSVHDSAGFAIVTARARPSLPDRPAADSVVFLVRCP